MMRLLLTIKVFLKSKILSGVTILGSYIIDY